MIPIKIFLNKVIELKDVLGIIQEPKIFKELILNMSSSQIIKNAKAIISIDARVFIFDSAISLQASKPIFVARKSGKLPGEIIKQNYKLEYGVNSLSMQKNALKKNSKYAFVDDFLATGGTVKCVSNLLERKGKKVLGLVTVVELRNLQARSKFNFPVESSMSL